MCVAIEKMVPISSLLFLLMIPLDSVGVSTVVYRGARVTLTSDIHNSCFTSNIVLEGAIEYVQSSDTTCSN